MNQHKKKNPKFTLFVMHLLQDMELFYAKKLQLKMNLNILQESLAKHRV
jgi:hypothetical protein